MLLDDRIAEHVPGCNMAFRRDALLAIDGFNPIYLRAGDDVDVCWRLQARGWKIGFAGAALVWHHHRTSVKAYWRQQVGYGEGETWLMAHHPEKFLDGHMLWRGRIYSPLPFVRSLWSTKINAGVWGTAAFPSVYRTDVHPFAFLPHSIRWQVISFVLAAAGAGVAIVGGHQWAAAILLASGTVGIAATIAKNIAYAMRSEVDSLPATGPARRRKGRPRARAAVVPLGGRLPALHPADRPSARTHSRRVVSAGSRAAGRRSADEPRSAPVARRGVARAAAHLGQRHRGSVLERDVDVGRTRAVAAHGLAAPLTRRPHDRNRRGLVGRPRRQRVRRPLGLARRARARRGTQRRQGARPGEHPSASDDVRDRQRARPGSRAAGRRSDTVRASVAARRHAGRRRDAPADRGRGLADGADHRHHPARHRGRDRRRGHGGAAVRPRPRAAHRPVHPADVRSAQRDRLPPDDPLARRRHVHPARGGHRPRHRRPQRDSPATTDPPSKPGSTSPAASWCRPTATSTSPTRTTT